MSYTPHQLSLKSQLTSLGSAWSPTWENILRLDPTYFAAYLRLRLVPVQRQHLQPKIQELLLLAIDASVTHLFQAGIRAHTAAALAAGATPAEVLEVLELTSVLGVHAINVGVPLLGEVLAEEGLAGGPGGGRGELDERRRELKSEFERKRGYWHETWDQVLDLDPDFFEAYTHFSAVPFRQREGGDEGSATAGETGTGLSPKIKEFVYIAIDCATTHLYVPGLKLHIRNAVRLGATKEEVMEIFELASLMGVQSVMVGVEGLMQEMRRK
jgi:alkylhydroperoxidase/carboxymuconolactone decarboxylase family protein YurZ